MKKQQSGFTMIELIMVIVILGILAAFALPRFADFGGDARVSTVNGIGGALRSAAAIAHAQQLVDGGAHGASVTLEGQTITMIGGFPTADEDGIVAAAQVDSVTVTGGADTAGATITFTPSGGGATCQVTYTAATPAGTDPAVSYSVEVTDTGC
ncbi:pilin [Stutzerimonas stutzeri]